MTEEASLAARILGGRIRDRRLFLEFSQDEIANLAGTNVSNYGKIERGQITPRVDTLIRIAKAINIDPGELVAGLTPDSLPNTVTTYSVEEFRREKDRRNA